jgi:hypothetical protein
VTSESTFRVAFWILFEGLLVMRGYFSIQVRLAGERLLSDQEAVEREGRGTFAVRTALKDGILLNELEGYREYAQQTHDKLLPGVW